MLSIVKAKGTNKGTNKGKIVGLQIQFIEM
jgi:hypothetical protein